MDHPAYQPASDVLPLSDDELQLLDEQLQALPGEGAMNIEALDGYLTALLVAPVPLAGRPGAEWLPVVWGGDGDGGAPFSSGKQRKRITLLVLRHLRHLDEQLRQAAENPAAWQPVFSVAEVKDEEWVDAEDWCAGFLRAVELDTEAWGPWFDDATLGPALVPIALLGGDDDSLDPAEVARLQDPAVCDELSRAVVDAVLLLRERVSGL